MKSSRTFGVAAAFAISLTCPALVMAQASSPTRAEVKAQTKQAVKERATTPAGEAVPDETKAPDTKSTKTRAERKAQTMEARKGGELAPAGTKPDYPKGSKAKSDKTRAERKEETRQARKEGKLAPAGESATPAK
jgi:hypothetical protein